jgi:hypothetical protein
MQVFGGKAKRKEIWKVIDIRGRKLTIGNTDRVMWGKLL